MATLNGDHFIDILDERRKTSDIAWVSRKWNCNPCRYGVGRKPREIKEQVLKSQKVQNIIKQLKEENGQSEEELTETAEGILAEMAHNFQLKSIRFFGFVLSKLMKQIYGSVLVNKRGLEKVANISSQYPILYLPTHRSYADFLLVSYICFQFDLPIPVIAAGLDFLGLNTLSALLRSSGAFFIKRSFIDDRLYWEIFSEYVQSHMQGCEFPIEFFIEGTRSRTAKSLVPKLGMLQAIMEEVFQSKMPDITIVPISISYDRTLEESLYAYELLGVPKPKESAKSLFKARKILSYHYGNVYVRFGDPISSKDFFRHHDRTVHNLHPRCMSVTTKEEQMLCRDLANHIIRMHQCNLLMSPFPLMCMVIGNPSFSGKIHLDHLADMVFWLEELVRRTGASIYTGEVSASEAIAFHLHLHSNFLQISEDSIVSVSFSKKEAEASSAAIQRLKPQTLKSAIPSMFIYHYGNQVMQLLVHMCMVCMSLSGDYTGASCQNDVYYRYNVLRKLLQREFVFGRLSAEKDFFHALESLREEAILTTSDSKIFIVDGMQKKVDFLQQALLFFLQSYYIICSHLLAMSVIDSTCQELAKKCQVEIETAIINGSISDYKCLSLDIANNCIAFLIYQGAVRKEKSSDKIILIPSHTEILNLLSDVEMFLPNQRSSTSHVIVPTAKL